MPNNSNTKNEDNIPIISNDADTLALLNNLKTAKSIHLTFF